MSEIGDPGSRPWKTRIIEECQPSRLIPNLAAGLVVSVIVVIVSVSLGTLIFAGEVSQHLATGLGIMLFSGIVITLVVSLASSYAGMVAYPQERVAPILAVMAAYLVSQLGGTASAETLFYTVVAAIAFTSLVNGMFLSVLGVFKLGAFVRFVPYPVIGGFLAGTGYLLVKGSLGVMTGLHIDAAHMHQLFEEEYRAKWMIGILYGIVLVLVTHRWKQSFVLPGLLLGASGVFYVVIAAMDVTPDGARANGWLLGPFPEGEAWQPITYAAFMHADWGLIAGQLGNIGTVLVISIISVLLNSAALELIVKRDIDLNRELKVAGVANLVIGLGGGTVGFHSLSVSRLVHRMNVNSRMVGVIAASACALTLFLGFGALTYLPQLVLGGLLFFLGMHFLIDWVYSAWFRMTLADYLVVILILGVVAVFGYLQGVVVGIIACIILFLVNYSRVAVVKHSLSGANQQSNVDRPLPHYRCLQEHGEQIRIFRLQGYIFFGTANGLLESVRARLSGSPPLRFMVLDFKNVTGLDSSAVLSFTKMLQLAEMSGFTLMFAQPSAQISRLLDNEGFSKADPNWFRVVDDLDHGLEWCEEQILANERMSTGDSDQVKLEDLLRPEFAADTDLDALLGYLERIEIDEGQRLIEQGAPADDLFLIEKGSVTARLEIGGETIRLRTMCAGAIVGELGMILGKPRSATVVTDAPTTAYRLSKDALRRMEAERPEVALAFHQFMTHLIADRLASKDKAIRLLLD